MKKMVSFLGDRIPQSTFDGIVLLHLQDAQHKHGGDIHYDQLARYIYRRVGDAERQRVLAALRRLQRKRCVCSDGLCFSTIRRNPKRAWFGGR